MKPSGGKMKLPDCRCEHYKSRDNSFNKRVFGIKIKETKRDTRQLTGLMSLFREAMKSSLLTCSFSAVCRSTSTVLLAYNTANSELYRAILEPVTWNTAHLDCIMCQKTMFSHRAERSDREGGKSKCLEEWRKTSRPSDMLSVIYHHPLISPALRLRGQNTLQMRTSSYLCVQLSCVDLSQCTW